MTLIALYDRRDWRKYATVNLPIAIAVYHRTLTLVVPRWNPAYDLILDNRLDTVIRYGGHIWDVETVTNTADQITLIACRYAFDQLAEPWTFDSYLAARTTKENPMPDTIDPTTCKPGEYYLVRQLDRTAAGMREDQGNGNFGWRLAGSNRNFADFEVAVLHRLVPESEAKTLDVPIQPWELVRATRQVLIDHDRYTGGDWMTERLEAEAAHLEREHRAAQEKAEQDAAREALIEKATDAYNRAAEAQARRAPLGSRDTAPWRDGIRAVIDTVLAEAVQP